MRPLPSAGAQGQAVPVPEAVEGSTHPGGHDDRRMAKALAAYRRENPYCEWPGCPRLADHTDHIVPLAELPKGDPGATTQRITRAYARLIMRRRRTRIASEAA